MGAVVWSADCGWHDGAQSRVVWVTVRHDGRERTFWMWSQSDWRDVFAYRFGYCPDESQLLGVG